MKYVTEYRTENGRTTAVPDAGQKQCPAMELVQRQTKKKKRLTEEEPVPEAEPENNTAQETQEETNA